MTTKSIKAVVNSQPAECRIIREALSRQKCLSLFTYIDDLSGMTEAVSLDEAQPIKMTLVFPCQ